MDAGAGVAEFGRGAADYVLTEVRPSADSVDAQARVGDETFAFNVHSAGTHFAMNALGALAACVELGVELDQAITGLGRWSPVAGRGVRESLPLAGGGQIELLDDSYNANPTSMEAALDVLAASKGTRRIAFLGDMKELGAQELAMHAAMADVAAMTPCRRRGVDCC